MTQTINRQCTLCEAHCGIQVEVEGERVLRITGDPDDVLSRGYICPKAAALADLQSDPDRLRRPVKKVAGRFVEIGWEEALSLAAERPAGACVSATAPTRWRPTSATPARTPRASSWRCCVRKLLGIAQPLLGDLGRPAAPVPELAGDVRPLRRAADPRRRAHRATCS